MSEYAARVWLYQPETAWEAGRFTEVEPDGRRKGHCPVYVPEQRALDAEREGEEYEVRPFTFTEKVDPPETRNPRQWVRGHIMLSEQFKPGDRVLVSKVEAV